MNNYSNYYREMLKEGEDYQEFIAEKAEELLGIPIDFYTTRYEQYNIGESAQGIEVKHDRMYSATGNLYFEVAEKANTNRSYYTPSGIYRDDNSWAFLTGNYDIAFFFVKDDLKKAYEGGLFREVENKYKTSKGFLMTSRHHYLAKKILYFNRR